MKTLVSIILLAITLVACGPQVGTTAEGIPHTATANPDWVRMVEEPTTVQDFTLPASTGETMSLSDLRGQWVLLFFGYIHCPDFCPLTLFDYVQAKEMLGAEADHVTFLYISVDGLRDGPGIMREYLSNFDPTFIGMTGDDETLERIHTDYNLYYQRTVDTAANAYVVEHSTRSYLLDPEGRLRLSFAYDTAPEIIAGVLADYLAETTTEQMRTSDAR